MSSDSYQQTLETDKNKYKRFDVVVINYKTKEKSDKESPTNLNPANQRNNAIVVTLPRFCPGQVSGQHYSKVWIPAIPDY